MQEERFPPGLASWWVDHNPELLKKCQQRQAACLRLWGRACSGLIFRHPNRPTKIHVTPTIHSNRYQPMIRMLITGLPDTGNSYNLIVSFLHFATPNLWPGQEAARKYLSAMFAIYMVHEAFELVTDEKERQNAKNGYDEEVIIYRGPIIDAHAYDGHHQNIITKQIHDVAWTLRWAIGPDADKYLNRGAMAKAEQEIEEEIAKGTPEAQAPVPSP